MKTKVQAVEFWRTDDGIKGDIKIRYVNGTDDYLPGETFNRARLKAKSAGVALDIYEVGAK